MSRPIPNVPPRRLRALAGLLVVGLAIAACSGSTAPAATSGPAATPSGTAPAASGPGGCTGAGVTFCGHVKISGGVAKESDFVSGVFFLTCADWLKGQKTDPTKLTLPIALVGDINTDAMVLDYHGPGSYDIASLAGNLGGFQVTVAGDRFEAGSSTTGTATVAADGSGSVTATGMQPAGDANKVQKPVDLSLTWTCSPA